MSIHIRKKKEEYENKKYKNVVISGGAIKGIASLGALQYLVDNQFICLQDTLNYIGTSVGGIISYLLIIGYTPIEIFVKICTCLLYTSPSPRDVEESRMPSSA